MAMNRSEIMTRLRRNLDRGIPVLATSAGIGLCAHAEEVGGADLIYVEMAGYHRIQGRSSLFGDQPIMDAHDYVLKAADDILPLVRDTPVIAGVMGNDSMHVRTPFLEKLKYLGYSGIINAPSMVNMMLQLGSLDRDERIAPSGWSYQNEVALVEQAHALDLLAVGNVYTDWHAEEMAAAGADIIVADLGITVGGRVGGPERFARTMEEAEEFIQTVADIVHRENPDTILCCHGGLLNCPEAVERIYRNVRGIQGFFAASAVERIPVETAIAAHIKAFTDIRY